MSSETTKVLFIKCPECDYTQKASNVTRHLKKHKYTDDEMKKFKDSLIDEKAKKKGGSAWICPCGHRCVAKRGIEEHIDKYHKAERSKTLRGITRDTEIHQPLTITEIVKPKRTTYEARNLQCPIGACESFVTSREELCKHLNKDHDEGNFEIEEMKFDSVTEYETWLSSRRESTCTTFCRTSTKIDGNKKTCYHRCSNEGEYESKAKFPTGHVSRKRTGQRYCSCFLKLKINMTSGEHEVTACFSHVNHDKKWAEQRYTSAQLELIIKYINDGLYNRQILNKLYSDNEENSRLFFTVNEDIRVIRDKYNLHPGRLHVDDLTSVETRVNAKNVEDGIKTFLKPDPSGKGLIMVIITPKQEEYLKMYAHKGVIIDDTYNITRYQLNLTTLLVVDDNDRGRTAAFLISNATSSNEIDYLFQQVKLVDNSFCPEILMSDEAGCFWKSYCNVFPENLNVTKRLMCRWHIQRAWKKNVNSYIDKKEAPKVMKKLMEVLNSPSEYVVKTGINVLLDYLTKLNTPGSLKFVQYFKSIYLSKIELWSTAYRDEAIVQTSMFAESWHFSLKSEFMNKKTSIRLDNFLHILLNSVDSIKIRRFVGEKRGHCRSNLRKCDQRAVHILADEEKELYDFEIIDQNSLFIIRKSDETRTYNITYENKCTCGPSNTHCTVCGICCLNVKCSCLVQKSGLNCKHGHIAMMKIGHFFKNKNLAVQQVHSENDEMSVTVPQDITMIIDERDVYADKLSANMTNVRNHMHTIERETRNLAKIPTQESFEKSELVRKKLEEIAKLFETSSEPSLVPRRDNVNNALPQTAAKVMHCIAKKNTGDRKRKLADISNIDIDPKECDICDICKLAESPFDCQSHPDKSKYLSCSFCHIRVHNICATRLPSQRCKICKCGHYSE